MVHYMGFIEVLEENIRLSFLYVMKKGGAVFAHDEVTKNSLAISVSSG